MNTFLLRSALHHFAFARYWNGHRVHSPFVYDFVRHVVSRKANDDKAALAVARHYRRQLKENSETIEIKDLGTGHDRHERISRMARNASVSDKCGRLLMRIVEHYKPLNIIEIGTSLGISTAYIAAPNIGTIHTIEGNPSSAEMARTQLSKAGIGNVKSYEGNFDEILPNILRDVPHTSLAFVDGNHTYEASMRYFNMIADTAKSNETIIVFDDIHWSEGMQRAWNEIAADSRVKTSIDLMHMGVVFFRSGCPKEHYSVRW